MPERFEAEGEVGFDKILVDKNFDLMNREMKRELSKESIGGNAEGISLEGVNYPCAGVNFIIDKNTGEIICFENSIKHEHDPEKEEKNIPLLFRVAFDPKSGNFFRIVDTYGFRDLSPEAIETLRESIRLYNDQFTNLMARL